jgi:hypothetical protein
MLIMMQRERDCRETLEEFPEEWEKWHERFPLTRTITQKHFHRCLPGKGEEEQLIPWIAGENMLRVRFENLRELFSLPGNKV